MSIWDVKNWFERSVIIDGKKQDVTEEQAEAILDSHKNAIITARAGTGKTTTIVAKIIYLIAHEGYDPESIVAFAFNKDASREINKRLSKTLVDGKPLFPGLGEDAVRVATTFHSFAARSLATGFEVLSEDECDDKNKQAWINNRSFYIQTIIKERLSKKKILEFMRNESIEDEATSASDDVLATKDDNYYETLNGEIVKSYGEKIIADYLFEHDIKYRYEKGDFYPVEIAKFIKDDQVQQKLRSRNVIRPDFYLEDYKLVWEHWGIRGDETPEEIRIINEKKVFSDGYASYKANMEWKKWFYGRKWLDGCPISQSVINSNYYLKSLYDFKGLISTYKNPVTSKEEFEVEIEKALKEKGISKPKLSEEAIIDKLLNNKNQEVVASLTEKITRFIDKAEQKYMSDIDTLAGQCKKEKDPHVALFYELALAAYELYLNELTTDVSDVKNRSLIDSCFVKRYTIDYSMMLSRATEAINARSESSRVKIDNYRYIMIDEYQDFSELFHGLINAIRQRAKEAKMTVVGDDWQAINSYAGSDLRFFSNFEDYYPEDCRRMELLTNFRSVKEIVEQSNAFMENAGISGNGAICNQPKEELEASDDKNALQLCNITTFIKQKNPKSNRSHIEQKYDLAIKRIIEENKGLDICILSRKRQPKAYLSTKDCKNCIQRAFRLDDITYKQDIAGDVMDKVFVTTVNKAKGLQADVVIILDTDNGSFPVIHPDTKLYRVFGDDKDKSIDEQKRLFYVALTRPRKKLYIFHENDIDEDAATDDNFLTILNQEPFSDFVPQTNRLEDQIIKGQIHSFMAMDVSAKRNKKRPENTDYTVTAVNGEQITQFNVSTFRDKDSCEAMSELTNFFKNNPNKGKQVWVEAREGRWIHFLKPGVWSLGSVPTPQW